jgi:Ni2+-binding GTPase involved in maturation of urease and hydrogenase
VGGDRGTWKSQVPREKGRTEMKRTITIYAGEPGCGKTMRASRELQSYLQEGKNAVLYDDMPADTDYNEIIKNDKHEVILITTCQC